MGFQTSDTNNLMIYRITCIGLIILGIAHLIESYVELGVSENFLIDSGIGVSTILMGFLNLVYLYETPQSPVPRYILLTVNALFIGYIILMIGNAVHLIPSYITLAFLILTSIQVLNRKV